MTATFYVGDAIEVWYCRLHRAAESAEEGICEVAARVLLVPGPYPKDDYPAACDIARFRLVPVPT